MRLISPTNASTGNCFVCPSVGIKEETEVLEEGKGEWTR
jgi:hypothetical protein